MTFEGPKIASKKSQSIERSAQLSDQHGTGRYVFERTRWTPEEIDSFNKEEQEDWRVDHYEKIKDDHENRCASANTALVPFGIDVVSLDTLTTRERLLRLLDVAALHVDDAGEVIQSSVRDAALDKLKYYVMNTENGVASLFESFRSTSVQGIKDIEAISLLYISIYKRFKYELTEPDLDHTDIEEGYILARVLNEFDFCAQKVIDAAKSTSDDDNYLFTRFQIGFATEISSPESVSDNPDLMRPFKITRGLQGIFSEDLRQIYIVDDENLQHIEEKKSERNPSSSETEHRPVNEGWGDFFPRVNQGKKVLKDEIIDQGLLLDDHVKGIQTLNPYLKKGQIEDYVTLLTFPVRSVIEKDLNLSLADLSIREQLSFLEFAKSLSNRDFKAFQDFANGFGVDGLRTFLVSADDPELRERIIAFSKVTPVETVGKVFETFGKLVESIDVMGDYLYKTFGSKNAESSVSIVKKMLVRAQGLLISAHEYRDDTQTLLKIVDTVNAENIMFYEGFKELRSRGEIVDFNDIEGLDFRGIDVTHESLSKEDREEMIRITNLNYATKSEEFRNAVEHSLTDAFNRSGTKFYVLRFKGKVVGFNRFDEMEPAEGGRPRKYFGSFNVDPAFGNGKIGDVMIEQTIGYESRNGTIIEAHCLPDAPVTQRYLKDGFKVVGEEKTMYPEPVWHIVLDSRAPKNLSQ